MTTAKLLAACAAVAAVFAGSTAAEAQVEDAQNGAAPVLLADTALLAAVADHTVEGMDGRDLVFDPTFLGGESAGSSRTWDQAAMRRIAERLGGRIGSLDDHFSCRKDGPPGYCFMHDADAVLGFGVPDLDGDEGTILVRVMERVPTLDDRAFPAHAVLKVARRDGRWEVVGVESVWVS